MSRSQLAVLLVVIADACGALHAGMMAGAPPHVRCSAASPRASSVIMGRKGRPKMPSGGMQGQYAQGAQQRAPEAMDDGTPVFYLYCRSAPGKPWYTASRPRTTVPREG